MSVTVVNEITYNHEEAKMTAMSAYPYAHPARRTIWEEYNVPLAGGDSFDISEFAWMPIWTSLKENGWEGTVFPAIGEKKDSLLKALTALLDVAVTEIFAL